MNKHSLEALVDFELVGVRFSRISVDESNIVENNSKFTITVEGRDPEISPHTYDGRSVIELVIGLSADAMGIDEGKQGEVFALECRAGFVGRDVELDGDLDRFAVCAPHFSRSVYWMLRERLDSIFSVTMLRTARPIHWDTLREGVSAVKERKPARIIGAVMKPPKKPAKKKYAKKKLLGKDQ